MRNFRANYTSLQHAKKCYFSMKSQDSVISVHYWCQQHNLKKATNQPKHHKKLQAHCQVVIQGSGKATSSEKSTALSNVLASLSAHKKLLKPPHYYSRNLLIPLLMKRGTQQFPDSYGGAGVTHQKYFTGNSLNKAKANNAN